MDQPATTAHQESLDQTELWTHSLAVALITRAAAEHLSGKTERVIHLGEQQPAQSELAYSAGLLHDLGKLALSGPLPKSLARTWTLARSSGQDLLDAERQILGFDHTALGQALGQRLRLPQILRDCIWLHHHLPQTLPAQLAGQTLLPLVIFADTLARELSLGQSGNDQFYFSAAELAEQIGLGQELLERLRQSVPQQVDDARLELQLDDPPQRSAEISALGRIVAQVSKAQARLKQNENDLTRCRGQLARAENLCREFAETARKAADDPDTKTQTTQLSEIASGAGHELNNPLAVIAGRSQVLAQKEKDPQKKKALEVIEQQARSASLIVSQLLEAVEPPQPSPQPTDLVPIIRKLCAALAGKAQASDAQVICQLPDDLPTAFIDPQMFEQSLLEILKNALSALQEKPGTIRLTCQADHLQAKLTLEVADSGIGMDAAVARKAFVPFFSYKPAGRSRGLGLTRARSLIEANHGSLWIRSRPGRGTSVWMSLPLASKG